jgi:ACS family hexuronate transporter-like MFS transporter
MTVTRRRLLLVLLFVAGVLNYVDRQIIAVLKPLLQEQLHWTDSDYGGLTSIFQLAVAIGLIGAGRLVDRMGWRRANLLSVASWSLAAMMHAVARTLGQFMLVRVALGATESLGTPTSIKTIAVLFEARGRSMALGALNAAPNIGAILTPLLVPALALTLGWQAAFLVIGGLGLLWVAVMFLLTVGQSAPNDALAPARVADGQGDAAGAHAEQATWRSVLYDRRTWAIAGAKILCDQVWWFLLFWMPDFFHRVFHLDMRGFAAPLAAVYAAAACGSLLGGFLSGRLIAAGIEASQARRSVMLVCGVLALPLPLALYVENYWLAVGLLGLTLAAHQGFSVNLFALTTDVTPSSRVATVISLAALFGNLSGMVVLAAAGVLVGGAYGYAPLFGLAAVSYLLALAWIRLLLPKVQTVTQPLAT